MARQCEKCKFSDIDADWESEGENAGDEYEIEFCSKGHSELFDDPNADCEFFKRYRNRKQ